MSQSTLAATICITLASSAVAQEPGVRADDPTLALTRVCENTARSSSLSFATIETQDNAMMRRFSAMADQETEVEGSWSDGVIRASIDVDADEVVIRGADMIARRGGGEWKRRHQSLAEGGRLPFVFDPERFFTALLELPATERSVQRTDSLRHRDVDHTVYSVTLEGETAKDFNHSGAVPAVGGGGMVMLHGLGGMGPTGIPDTTIDIAFWVDPTRDVVTRIRVKTYQKSGMPAGMQVRFAGPGGEVLDDEDAADDDVEEFDQDGRRIYRRGLPVRALDAETSAMEFAIELRDHGKPVELELDAGARRKLGLGG